MRFFLFLGSILMFFAVALGAFGAHGLKGKIPDDLLTIYQTGVHYQMIHGLGIILVAILLGRFTGNGLIGGAGWSFFIGILLFSGSLYAIAFTGVRILGMITPFGGVAFLLGWLLLGIAALRV
ncbi:conserved membrane hypothetical protein [[Clostridium] ultunense Esp]|uniref:DUF423 domain-containing protein n=1 Tax=Thermicanus aegyptius TaxID=94009 RepID=UPI0002B6FB4E|nr:DUF423 domain-containing protein [Thermicanus aegyptius]CCQ97286.1 conserved membrane hypothetical protein [[Clostridium] ultunense Esp]